jgi:predicted AlkP superfamily phosphohydrolase/phosphomutase
MPLEEVAVLGYIDPGSGFTIVSIGGWFIAFLLGFLGVFSLFFKKFFWFLKRHGKPFVIIFVIVLLVTALVIIGVIMGTKGTVFDKRVVILGFDGLSPQMIEPMMSTGELPNFGRLREIGSYRHLTTTNPSQSPVAWSGFATGQNPGKHGVYDFIVRDPKTYGLNLSLSNVEKGKAKRVMQSKCFWNYASEKRVPSTIITCPVTFPADKIYGRMISGMGVPDILGTEGTFTFYTSAPLGSGKDIGGKVFPVKKSSIMVLNLIGPKVSKPGRQAENLKVPFKVMPKKENNSVMIEYQQRKFELKKGQWSDWQEVSFKLGFFKNMKGIFKFYLVELEPEFKLYVSPINFDPRDPYFPIFYPPGYGKELVKQMGLFYTQGMPMDTWAVNEKRLSEEPFLEQCNMVLDEKTKMLKLELARMKKGVLFCYFESSDIIQHMFWRYIDPRHPLYEEHAPEKYKNTIRLWYKHMDDILGDVMQEIGPDDILIVLSDHGFDTFRRAVHVNSWLRQNGYLALKNQGAAAGAELLSDIDWYNTKVYAIGFGAMYINQEGREKHGIVKPGSETEALKDEITTKLKEWRDDKYDTAVVNEVFSREDIFWGPHAEETPDLYIGFNIGYRASWQTALGAAPKNLLEDNLKKWSGSHLFNPNLIPGIFFCNKQINSEKPSIYDVAPTVMKVIGYSEEELKESDLDGRPLL